jgi:hypothetical protein
VRTEYNAKMEKLRKQTAKQKEKSDRKKALASMSKDKTKSANQASERKQKVTNISCFASLRPGDETRWLVSAWDTSSHAFLLSCVRVQ